MCIQANGGSVPAASASLKAFLQNTVGPSWMNTSFPASEQGVRLVQNVQVGPYAFLWEYRYRRLKLAQLLGQLGIFLTWD